MCVKVAIDQGGIIGFMAGAVRSIVTVCHVLGWKFYLADVISAYDVNDSEKIDKRIKNLMDCEQLTLDEKEVREYVDALIKRMPKN